MSESTQVNEDVDREELRVRLLFVCPFYDLTERVIVVRLFSYISAVTAVCSTCYHSSDVHFDNISARINSIQLTQMSLREWKRTQKYVLLVLGLSRLRAGLFLKFSESK
jgi:hypothetical protein